MSNDILVILERYGVFGSLWVFKGYLVILEVNRFFN